MRKLAYLLVLSLAINTYANSRQDTFDQYSKDYEHISSNLIHSGALNNKINPNDYAKDYSDHPKELDYYGNPDQMQDDSQSQFIHDKNIKATADKYKNGAYKNLVNPNSPSMKHAADIMQYSYEYSHGISTDKFDCQSGKSCRWTTEPKSCEISQDFTTTCMRTPIVKVDFEDVGSCNHYVINGTTITVVSGANAQGYCQVGVQHWQASGNNRSIDESHTSSIQTPANYTNVKIVLFSYMTGQFSNTSAGTHEAISGLGSINVGTMSHKGYYENSLNVPQSKSVDAHSFSIGLGFATGRGLNTVFYGTFVEYPQKQPYPHVTGYQENCQIPDTSQCTKTAEKCTIDGSTRYFDGLPLYENCWQYKRSLTCSSGHIDTCTDMSECDPTGQSCILKIADTCTRYKRTYACPKHVCDGEHVSCGSLKGDIINNRDNQKESEEDFDQAVAGLAAASAAGNGIKDQNTLTPEIFKGNSASCGKAGLGVYDCCDSDGNILMHCSEDDKALKKARDKGITTYVGEYCAKKDPVNLMCLVTRKSYCVFPSKLDRIVQEQGRKDQLGISFGDAKNPNCRGLSIDELQKLDLSTMDLSAIYDDLKISSPSTGDISSDISKDYDKGKKIPEFDDTDTHDAQPESPLDDKSTDSYKGKNR